MSRKNVFAKQLAKFISLPSSEVEKGSHEATSDAKTSTLRVYIEAVPGSDVSKSTIKLWKDNARKRKWNIEFLTNVESRKSCDVVVMPSGANLENLVEVLRQEVGSDEKVVVVRSEWIFNSLRMNTILEYSPEYRVDISKVPQKAQPVTVSELMSDPPVGVSISPQRQKPQKNSTRLFLCKENVEDGKITTQAHSNDHLVKHLELIKDSLLSSARDSAHRQRNYTKVIHELKSYAVTIKNADQLTEFWLRSPALIKGKQPGAVTKSSIFQTLCQFLEEGESTKGYNALHNPELAANRDLLRIWGAGARKVSELRALDINSIAECRAYVEDEKRQWEENGTSGPFVSRILTQRQLVGLQLADEFDQRIPRDEVAHIEALVSDTLRRLPGGEHAQGRAVGSYRRGSESCGDVDILVSVSDTAKAETELNPMIPQLVATLMQSGFITHLLTSFEKNWHLDPRSDCTTTSFMGVCKLPGSDLHRRIDIKQYSRSEYPFALLYFTGSGHFNRSMRCYVGHHGGTRIKGWAGPPGFQFSEGYNSFSLNDQGLYEVHRAYAGGPETSPKGRNLMPDCRSEKEIFEMLNLPWKEPWERTAEIDKDNPLYAHKDSQGLDRSDAPSHRSDDDLFKEDLEDLDALAPSPKRAKY